jgi:hypothetical protein
LNFNDAVLCFFKERIAQPRIIIVLSMEISLSLMEREQEKRLAGLETRMKGHVKAIGQGCEYPCPGRVTVTLDLEKPRN